MSEARQVTPPDKNSMTRSSAVLRERGKGAGEAQLVRLAQLSAAHDGIEMRIQDVVVVPSRSHHWKTQSLWHCQQ